MSGSLGRTDKGRWALDDSWSNMAQAEQVEARESPTRDGFRYHHRLQVRFRDCDPMGHVNNAVYFTFIEMARFGYWKELVGLIERDERSFIIARAECDYRSPALPGELLDVWIRVPSIGRSSFPMEYEVVGASDGRLVATARTVQVMFDYGTGQSFPVPDQLAETLERFEGRPLRK